MPLGDSPTDSKSKTPIRKVLAFLSPLLIVSIGLHGLAMLLPVPEREETVEESDLPESIQVSELPEVDLPQTASGLEPVIVSASRPKAPPTTQSPVTQPPITQPRTMQPSITQPPVTQPPVVTAQPEPPRQELQTQPVQPQPTAPDSHTPEHLRKQEPVGKDPVDSEQLPTGSSSIKREYYPNRKEQKSTELYGEFTTLLGSGEPDDPSNINNIAYLKDGTLTLTLSAGDNCFPEAQPVDDDSVMLKTSFAAIVRDDGAGGTVDSVALTTDTGYDEANDAVAQLFLEIPGRGDAAYEQVDSWLREQNNGPFPFEGDERMAYLIWNVDLIFTNHSCPDNGPNTST